MGTVVKDNSRLDNQLSKMIQSISFELSSPLPATAPRTSYPAAQASATKGGDAYPLPIPASPTFRPSDASFSFGIPLERMDSVTGSVHLSPVRINQTLHAVE